MLLACRQLVTHELDYSVDRMEVQTTYRPLRSQQHDAPTEASVGRRAARTPLAVRTKMSECPRWRSSGVVWISVKRASSGAPISSRWTNSRAAALATWPRTVAQAYARSAAAGARIRIVAARRQLSTRSERKEMALRT